MQVRTQINDLQNYLTDASNIQGGYADKLFIPESDDEIAQIVRDANACKTPVAISGARTGTVGGAIPFGGYIISLEKLNKIQIDKKSKMATVGAGVILADLQKAVDAEGLFYPPDPTEWSCQLGGTVATNASGARSFKYGATRDYVNALKVVLANGQLVELRRGEVLADANLLTLADIKAKVPSYERPNVRKNVSGYYNKTPLDAIDLFVGSEGTLGVVTEIALKLLAKPKGFFSGVVFFEKDHDLLTFVEAAKGKTFASVSCIEPTLLEFFDANALRFIAEKFPETPSGMSGAIFFEQETTAENEDSLLEAWNALLEKHNADLERSWFTTNEQDREKMRSFRHALPVSVNERVVRSKQKKVGTDMAVPHVNFGSLLRYYKETLDTSGLDYVIFGHIGDCHLHVNMLPRDDDEAEKARHIYGRFIAHAIMLGGTVSAEHGIGKLKRKYLAAMMGERYLNEMAELKRAFDPNGIFGRGNMFDEKFLN